MTRRTGLQLRTWLLLLVLVGIVPISLFSAWIIIVLAQGREDAVRQALSHRAEAGAYAVSLKLDAVANALIGLSVSQVSAPGELHRLYENATYLQKLFPESTAIDLVDRGGRVLVNTVAPFGVPVAPTSGVGDIGRVFREGKPSVSELYLDQYSKKNVVAVGVPVREDGRIVYCLRMILTTDGFSKTLRAEHLPDDWLERIVDQSQTMVARNIEPEKFVGTKVAADLAAALASGRTDVFDMKILTGQAVKTAFAKVPGWDWSLVVSVPSASLGAPLRRGLHIMAIAGFACLAGALLAAAWLAQYLSRQVGNAMAASTALQRGESVSPQPTAIREFTELARTLGDVHLRENQTATALMAAVAAQQQSAMDLLEARHDPLTRLANRALFIERSENLRLQASSKKMALALMFVDLDGLKKVNDRFGHERGDSVLISAAAILAAAVRDGDAVGRIGGDEFALCMVAPRRQANVSAQHIADRVIDSVKTIGAGVGCSIGIVLAVDAKIDIAVAMAHADAAMYTAKRDGGNRYRISEELL